MSGAPFPIFVPLSGGSLDRAAHLRPKPEEIDALRQASGARVALFWRGKPLIDLTASPRLAWLPLDAPLIVDAKDPPLFLGCEEGAGRFAVTLSHLDEDTVKAQIPAETKLIDLRSIAGDLPIGDAGNAAQAKSMTEWHASHRFCSTCGAESMMAEGGWRRDCPACGAKHFPRTDPVIIALAIHRPAEGEPQILLGRQSQFPPGLYSLLAGYVEPGETIEEATARELWEEAGVRCGPVRYLASQPWPFPSTLMVGVYTEIADPALTPDFDELEDCRWASLSEMRQVFAGEHPKLIAPRVDAIARVLLEAWVTGRVA
ncbi:MAG: NAD(+) diphosphatase [Pseudomonadota bacterium]